MNKIKRIFEKIYNFFAYLSLSFMGLLFLLLLAESIFGYLGAILVFGFMVMVRRNKKEELAELRKLQYYAWTLSRRD